MRRFLANQWFLLMLAAVLAIGFTVPEPFVGFANTSWIRNSIVATVLFLMALPLQTSAMLKTMRRPQAALLGSLVNMGLMPLLAWMLAPLATGELAIGLLITGAAPCTLASASVWTRRAGGNDAVAILVTLLTNATCFVTTPFWILLTTGRATSISPVEMIGKLGLLVVLPMTLAQFCRLSPFVAELATRRKIALSTIAQLGILSMVLIGAVKTSESLGATHWRELIGFWDFVILGLLVVVFHLLAMATGWYSSALVGLARGDQIAVSVAGSQKTLMVGLFVAVNYFGGLTILPLVAYHVAQLFVDTLVADYWKKNAPG